MESIVDLTKDAVIMGFAASCVEHVARNRGVSYRVVYDALKRTDAFRSYIVPHYETLHTQSREWVNEDIMDYLRRRGERL